MIKRSILSILAAAVLGLFFSACNKSSTGPSTAGSAITYGGASPVGDYIAVTVRTTDHTVTYYNYTTSESAGPFTYSRLTTNNWGFQNLYQTQDFVTGPGDTCYAKFMIMEGIALVYQLFKARIDSAIEWPVYALSRAEADMNNYKGQAFNWMNFKINASTGNFEAGFAAFDTDPGGFLYGTAYNNRAEREGWGGFDNGVKKINDYDSVKASSFVYNSSIVANTLGDLTLIGTESGDFVMDFGPYNGAGFAVRQASDKSWSANYNGTYFVLVYENENSPTHGIDQTVIPMRLTASGGTISVSALEGGNTISPAVYSGTFTNLEDFTGGPHYSSDARTITQDFQYFSRCDTAQSAAVRNAYKCHGCFIENSAGPNEHVVTAYIDPSGNFLFFCMFERDSNNGMNYRFGFGIKDPNYIQP